MTMERVTNNIRYILYSVWTDRPFMVICDLDRLHCDCTHDKNIIHRIFPELLMEEIL